MFVEEYEKILKKRERTIMAAKKANAKPAVKSAEAAVKVEAPKTESVKTEDKAATPEKTVKKASAKKEAVKKDTERKKPGRKPSVKKTLTTELYLQFADQSLTQEDLVNMAKDVWKYDLEQKEGDLTSLELYVKPEEHRAYYVMNKEFSGSFYI